MSNHQPTKETQTPMTQAAPQDPFRDYQDDTAQPPAAPTGDINEIQLLTSTARVWWMRTRNPLSAVLADEYWTTMTDVRLQAEDVIQLVSSFGTDRAEHSVLAVDSADRHGKATVRVLHRYLRSAA
jgi:hypothetical protein